MKMLLKYNRLLAFSALIIILLLQTSSVYAASDPFSASMPKLDDVFDYANNPNHYITTYKDNYFLDDTAGFFSPVESAFNGIADMMFQIQYFMAQILIILFWYVFNFNIFDVFKDLITTFLTEMKVNFFDTIVAMLLMLTGAYFIQKKLQRRIIEFWVGIGIIVLVLVASTFFFKSPMKILDGLNDATNDISQVILGASKDPVKSTSNSLWDVFVVKPWQNVEFGNPELAKENTDKVLSVSDSKERKALFKSFEDADKWNNMGVKRCVYLLVMFVPTGITYLVLFAICLLSIGFQALMLIVFLLGPFVFALAVIPEYGPNVLKKWAMLLISLAAAKIVMVILLKILTSFLRAMLTFGETQGWGMVFIIQLITFAMIFFYRNQIKDIFTVSKSKVSGIYSLGSGSGSGGKSLSSKNTTSVSEPAYGSIPVSSKSYHIQRKKPVVYVDDEGNESTENVVTTFNIRRTKYK